jgi:23S rRNA (adenine2503-C2)-methyltransferase
MKTTRVLSIPTGNILIVEGQHGPLEMLSLGDYGKNVNVKCRAMGLDRDIERVHHRAMLPLEEKWVITVSTQYGCDMGCRFCDVPRVGRGRNATCRDLIDQVLTGVELHPEVTYTDRLNIHFARMGEPTLNPMVLAATAWMKVHLDPTYRIHPVVSTMMPDNRAVPAFIDMWMAFKNELLEGEAGLQISINSTNELERASMFRNHSVALADIHETMRGHVPVGRKITLNFAVADYQIDPDVLLRYFDPRHYMVKLTPMHKTAAAIQNGIETSGDYTTSHPYAEHEERLVAAGYDVLVFVASEAEDLGRITCGNAILSGTLPSVPYTDSGAL